MAKIPQYLQETGYKCPTDNTKAPLQFAFQTNLEAFQFWGQSPEILENFNTLMTGIRGARPSWVHWFPVKEQILSGFSGKKEDVLLVDVAGGRGHDVTAFKKKFPDVPGHVVLEDLPQVIADIDSLDQTIKCIEYDFFTPQPIKGDTS